MKTLRTHYIIFFFVLFSRIKRKFLVSIIESIQRSKLPDDPDNLLKIKACIYIDALITYFKQVNRVRQNQTVRLDSLTEITTKLNVLIRKKFSQPNTFKTYVLHLRGIRRMLIQLIYYFPLCFKD